MPSSSSLSSSSAPPHVETQTQTLLASARPFLRGELESVHPKLPSLVSLLRSVGAGECWHKHGSFLDHLVDMYRIHKLWKAQESVCLCALFHSAYSNSYVNLAIFDPPPPATPSAATSAMLPNTSSVSSVWSPRQSLIHDDLLFRYPEAELVDHRKAFEVSLRNAKEKGVFDGEEAWRRKVNSLVPPAGVTVKHIKTGEDVRVPRRVLAIFLMMTMADFSDQLFGFQDALFDNSNGRLEFSGNSFGALWPGDGKPGLGLNSISRMGGIYSLLAREEEDEWCWG